MASQIAYEAITVATTAIGPTVATVTPRVRSALFYVKGAAVRWRADGTAPTATVGTPIEDGGQLILTGEGVIRNIQFIRRDAVSATVHASYFDEPLDIRQFAPLGVEGVAAHDAPNAGNPVKVAGKANTGQPTAVASGDIADVFVDEFGTQAVKLVRAGDATDLDAAATDTVTNPTAPGVITFPMRYNGVTWDRDRAINTFKASLGSASGTNAFWTPASGKKFRLMAFKADLSGDATQTVGGAYIMFLIDNATTAIILTALRLQVPAAAYSEYGWTTGWVSLGNGYLSAAANNVLAVNTNVPLATGQFNIIGMGTEE